MLCQKLLTLSDTELDQVLLKAGATFKAYPSTKEEAVAKKVFIAATVEKTLRFLRKKG